MKAYKYCFFLLLMALFFIHCSEDPTPESANKVIIDITQKKNPISPFIYGQFIEHLGRCIYGGLWAEMLEDRKFYYPVTSEYEPWGSKTDPYWNTGEFKILVASPWKETGPAGSVRMTSRSPLVGDHCPQIEIKDQPAGISQEGLYFEKDREYSGRIYLSSDDATVKISLQVDDGQGGIFNISEINDLTAEFKRYDYSFRPVTEINNGTLKITGTGNGSYKIGTLSLMPSNNIKGFNREVLSYVKELNAPIYRWPGGNFVSGYNWKDGIGARDLRPPRKNPAWTGIESNDVGIHEYMTFCDLIKTEPFICVNTGLGTVEEVAEQVEYCNSSVGSNMGKWRAKNGHPEPYQVKYWAVGNEMYGDWQLGHMPLSEYIKKHKKVAEAMLKADPSIELVAVGNAGEWSETMLKECNEHMDLISEHIYCKELDDVKAHVAQIPDNIKRVADIHRRYRTEMPELGSKNIQIAMDEWNYWHGDYLYGELGCRYYLKDALGIAAGFHEYYRNSDLFFMANYAQTVNVIGAIKTTQKEVEFAATGVVLKLYGNHYGQIPVEIKAQPEFLDIAASLDTIHSLIIVSVINTADSIININLELISLDKTTIVEAYEISADDPMAYNAPGESRLIDIKQKTIEFPEYVELKPYSVNLVKYANHVD